MTRNEFVKIIKLGSFWKTSKKRGNYILPDGTLLSHYIGELVRGQLMLDAIAPTASGDLAMCSCIDPTKAIEKDECGLPIYRLSVPFGEYEVCTFDEMEIRIKSLVNSVIHG